MSFSYTTGIIKDEFLFCPADDFLLHRYSEKKKHTFPANEFVLKTDGKKDSSTDRQPDIHLPPLDKRFSSIIYATSASNDIQLK